MNAETFVPPALFVAMVVVGLDLTAEDFRRVARYPRVALGATALQIAALPTLAAALAVAFRPDPFLTAALVFVATSPGGALSNFFTLVARGNVALSVTLTALSSALSLLTLPLLATLGLRLLVGGAAVVRSPAATLAAQILFFVIVPTGIGMAVRSRGGRLVATLGRVLRAATLAFVVAIPAWTIVDRGLGLDGRGLHAVTLSIAFTVLSFGLGAAAGRFFRLGRRELLAVAIECGARNVPVVMLVAVATTRDPDYLVFATLYFITQTPLLLGASLWLRRNEAPAADAPT